jgi:3-ketoacyl-CoA synthase
MGTSNSRNSEDVEWSSPGAATTAIKVRNTLREISQSVTMRAVLCMILILGFLEIHRVHEAIQILCGNQLQLPSFVVSLQIFSNQLGNQLEVDFRNFGDRIQILSNNQLQPHSVFSALFAFIVAISTYFLLRPRKVFLVDFACYKPDRKNALSKQQFLNFAASTGMYR